MAKILVKKLDPSIELPAYKTEGASGMDLMAFIKEPIILKSQNSCLVPTGIAVAFSNEFEIQIRPRSGLAAKNSISVLNTPGTIDSDYRGEIKVILYNHGKEDFLIRIFAINLIDQLFYQLFHQKFQIFFLYESFSFFTSLFL